MKKTVSISGKVVFPLREGELFSVKVEHLIDDRMIDAYFVMCSAADCGCLTQYCETPEKAVGTWNRRDGT